MKWFKHFSDSHTNLKLQQVIDELGMEGYGVFWLCDEVVAQQGSKFRVKKSKNWKKSISYIARLSEEKIEKYCTFFASVNLISKKALQIGDLYMPKLADYGDEYTDKVRRVSRQGRDNVGLDKIRLDEKRLDKTREDENTPAQESAKFFSLDPPALKDLSGKIAEGKGLPPEFVFRELSKFKAYWTELTKNGKKQRWQLQPTFEVNRRFVTWVSRARPSQPAKQQGFSI